MQKLNAHTRSTFVRSSVEENDATTFVIDSVMPYYPRNCKVIGGYVDVSKQYWKANFHWEYLLRHLDKALSGNLAPNYARALTAIRAALVVNRPSPDWGYTDSKVMGRPNDKSGRRTVIQRWRNIRRCKRDFKSVLSAAKFLEKMDDKSKKAWLLAVAPVAKPGTSKHSTGYALDIAGNSNSEIGKIADALGASLVFQEGSHVHVEFADGVAGRSLPKTGDKAAATAPRTKCEDGEDACLLSPGELATLKDSTNNARTTGEFGEVVGYPETLYGLLDDVDGEDWWA